MPIVDLEQLEKNEAEALKSAQNDLDAELGEARKTEIPDKYRGKSLEDVIQMVETAQKTISRQGNEIGELRRYRETELELREKQKPQRKEVNVDALLENPEEAVETVIGQSSRIRELEEKVERATRGSAQKEFESKHPTFMKDLENEEFIQWAMANPVRADLAKRADKYDFSAADQLWSLWDERQELLGTAEKMKQEAKKVDREKKLRDGTLESGTGNSTETKKIFSRREIRDLKTRAALGDRKAQEIVNDPEWNAQVMQAYVDKRAR
jgi:hypothetical protein